MCRLDIDAKSYRYRRQRQLRPHRSIAEPKRAHLVTDDGFGRRLAFNLLAIACIVAVCSTDRFLRDFILDAYDDVKERTMHLAGEMAWWSLLGLLSSSCCAVQVLLNAMSLGCAGFNNALGPMRPTFVAVTIALQTGSWYAAYRSVLRSRWRATATSTLLSSCLTLMPEALAWRTARRDGRRRQSRMNSKDCLLDAVDRCASGAMRLQFRLSTMGCSSCVSTVSKVLDGIDDVLQHSVTLADGNVEIVLDEASVRMKRAPRRSDVASIQKLMWDDVAKRLESAGFPADFDSNIKKER